jgi:hypothetical protein
LAVDAYRIADNRVEKNTVICEIADFVKRRGGCFLKQSQYNDAWFPLTNSQIKQKVGHAIRDTRYSSRMSKGIGLSSRVGGEKKDDFAEIVKTLRGALASLTEVHSSSSSGSLGESPQASLQQTQPSDTWSLWNHGFCPCDEEHASQPTATSNAAFQGKAKQHQSNMATRTDRLDRHVRSPHRLDVSLLSRVNQNPTSSDLLRDMEAERQTMLELAEGTPKTHVRSPHRLDRSLLSEVHESERREYGGFSGWLRDGSLHDPQARFGDPYGRDLAF